MLDIVYDPQQIPERQHQLRVIPASSRVDQPQIHEALVTYEKARAAELEARRAHTQAEQELAAAEYKDELALADAQAKGRKDPGPVNAEKQRALIHEKKRQHGAAKITLERAVDRVVQAFAEHGEEWAASLEDERDKLREAMAELLTGWERMWGQLQVTVSNLALLNSGGPAQNPEVFAASFRAPSVRDGDVVFVGEVLDGLRNLAKPEPRSDNVVENVPVGHTPPSRQPFAGAGAQAVAMGHRVPEEQVNAWRDRDEATARAAHPDGPQTPEERERWREARAARADARRAEREARRDAEDEAIEATA